MIFLNYSTALLVVFLAMFAALTHAHYVWRHWHAPKRNMRLMTITAALYMAVIYSLLATGQLEISFLAALLARAGSILALSLLASEAIADWR